jgi:hypothetical protein
MFPPVHVCSASGLLRQSGISLHVPLSRGDLPHRLPSAHHLPSDVLLSSRVPPLSVSLSFSCCGPRGCLVSFLPPVREPDPPQGVRWEWRSRDAAACCEPSMQPPSLLAVGLQVEHRPRSVANHAPRIRTTLLDWSVASCRTSTKSIHVSTKRT